MSGSPFLRENFSGADLRNAEGAPLAEGLTSVIRLTEASKTPDGCIGYVEGVASRADVINRNLRFYSQAVLDGAVEAAQELITSGQFLGEVDHPWMGSLRGAAVRFTKLYMREDLMVFTGGILDTDDGRHLKGVLEGGVGVMVSTRGYGSSVQEVKKIGDNEVTVDVIQPDYRMEGIDFVLFPSNPAGKVKSFEHLINPKEQNMDLVTFRSTYPDLVSQVEAEARVGRFTQEEVDAAVEAARAAVLESEEVAGLSSLLTSVVAAIRPFVPALQTEAERVEQSAAERAAEELSTQVAALTARLADADAARVRAEAEVAEAAQAATRQGVIDALLNGYAHADLIRSELESLTTEAEIRAVFEARSTFISAVVARGGALPDAGDTGIGEAENNTGDDDEETSPETKALIAEQRRLAGLPVVAG